jgi:YidC/Oxa1 family membrane protein insertase
VLLIVFSILVKVVLHPLTRKSYKSTKEMQAIQPLVADLKNKYKGDSQKLNQETMKLYKEHGVNPLGGCLPMLLQMPILIALFTVFRSTIVFRGAPFMLWITDLSQPDQLFNFPFTIPLLGWSTFNVLPILMGATMIYQQKTMSVQSPSQQKSFMYIMNGFFLVIFYSFPAGLNLYYTCFNVLTILQQKYMVHPTPMSSPKPN